VDISQFENSQSMQQTRDFLDHLKQVENVVYSVNKLKQIGNQRVRFIFAEVAGAGPQELFAIHGHAEGGQELREVGVQHQ